MAGTTLFDRQADDAGTFKVYAANWAYQTFTPSVGFTLYHIDLLCFYTENGSPINPVLSIGPSEWDDDLGHQVPTGVVTGSKEETYSDLPVDTEDWHRWTLATPLVLVANTTYALFLKTASGDASNYIGWRISDDDVYGAVLVDVAGISPDSGSTWEMGVGGGEDLDFCFRLYGEKTAMGDDDLGVVLTPTGSGTHTELTGGRRDDYGIINDTDYNWKCVADPLGSPDDRASYVRPSIGGYCNGTVQWYDEGGASDDNIDSPNADTDFENDLEVGFFISRSNGIGDVNKVKTITDAYNVVLEYNHNGRQDEGPYKRNRGTWANARVATGLVKWIWEDGFTIEGAGGNDFTAELAIGDRVRPSGGGYVCYVHSIGDATHFDICDEWGEKVGVGQYRGTTQTVGMEISRMGEDEADKTPYWPTTQKDSYTIKSTMSRGTITGVKVVFRIRPWCGWIGRQSILDWEVESPPAVTAQPFLYHADGTVWGTEITLTPAMEDWGSNLVEEDGVWGGKNEWHSRFEYFTTAPGGGAWTWDKINSMEVGIQLSQNVAEVDAVGIDPIVWGVMHCTQLLVVVYQNIPEVPPDEDPDIPTDDDPDDPNDPPPAAITEPDPITAPVICTPAETKCEGFTLFTCNAAGTAWELTERNSETCGWVIYVPDPGDDPVKCRVSEYGLLGFDDGAGRIVDEYGNTVFDGMSERGYIQERFYPV